MDTLIQDLRYAIRQLRSRPGFTAAVVLTLALGIGVNSVVFSLANWVVLRPVPGVERQERLVVAEFWDSTGGSSYTSYPNLRDLSGRVTALSGLAGTLTTSAAIHMEGKQPRYLDVSFVSAEYFQVLGTRFAIGRPFNTPEELAAVQLPVAVISHRLWLGAFGADSGILGQYVAVNDARTLVIGVAPEGFHGTELLAESDVWMPGSTVSAIIFLGQGPAPLESRQTGIFVQLIGRLAPGATAEQARAQLSTAVAGLHAAYPAENARLQVPLLFEGIGVPTKQRDAARNAMILLGGIAAVVLLIACANVANLFLFRGLSRGMEWAVRQALGAPFGRLIRLQLVESLLVAAVAAVPAVLLALWITGLFRGPLLPGLGDIERIGIDWRVMTFTAGVALATGVLSGLGPALLALRSDILTRLKTVATSVSRGGAGLRAGLAAVQLALSLSLLVTMFLLVGTLRNLDAIDPGFDADRVTSFTIRPTWSGYSREQSLPLLREVLGRVQAIPGVEAAAFTAHAPFSVSMGSRVKVGDGATPNDSGMAATRAWASPEYFRTMGVRLLAGRTFEDAELFLPINDDRVVILSETLARRLFGSSNVVGREVSGSTSGRTARVVGLVEDSKWGSLIDEGAGPLIYAPLPSSAASGATILVRSPLAAASLRRAVEDAIGSAAPSVPVFDVALLRDRIDETLAEERLLARLVTLFAVLAITLAAIGLYAVVAFSVAERTKELGIRIALGARARQIVSMVVRRGAVLGAAGIGAGLAGAVALARLVASRLYGLSAMEPGVYALAAGLLLLLVLVASSVPALYATRVDPMTALRSE